jgi:hypothetical protein
MHVIHSNVRIAAVRKIAGSWLDRPTPSAYLLRMRRLSSILLLAFLAVFAVGNIAHAVSANDMALEMACPSSDDLGHERLISKGGSGSSVFQFRLRSGDAASGGSR